MYIEKQNKTKKKKQQSQLQPMNFHSFHFLSPFPDCSLQANNFFRPKKIFVCTFLQL